MNRDKTPRCPYCHGKVADWADHEECQIEAARARHDETGWDDYDEPRTA